MRIRTVLLVGILLGIVTYTGCIEAINPQTGERYTTVDPNVVNIVEPVAQGVATAAPLFGPIGGLVGGVVLGALAAWRRIKPSLLAAQSKADQYYAVASTTVTAIDAFKEASPETWEKLGTLLTEQMTKQGIDPKVIENVIRGLRGLPAKS